MSAEPRRSEMGLSGSFECLCNEGASASEGVGRSRTLNVKLWYLKSQTSRFAGYNAGIPLIQFVNGYYVKTKSSEVNFLRTKS